MIVQQFRNSTGFIYATVSYDEEMKCVTDTWDGLFGTREEFRIVLTYIVHLIEEKKPITWLANLQKMHGSFDDSKEWLAKVIVPSVVRAGLRFEAVVLPRNVFSKLSAKETILRISNFELRQFDDLEEAKTWLKDVVSTPYV